MLKFASDKNLSPALLEKLGQVYNTAKTVTYLDKSADAGRARGDSFNVLDIPSMLEKFAAVEQPPAEPAKVTPGKLSDVAHNPFHADLNFETEDSPEGYAEIKLASETRQKLADHLVDLANLDNVGQFIFETREDIGEAVVDLTDDLRKLASCSFLELEQEAIGMAGDALKGACDKVASQMEYLGYRDIERATDAGRPRFTQNTDKLQKLANIQDKMNVLEMALEYQENLTKEATATQHKMPSVNRGSGGRPDNSAPATNAGGGFDAVQGLFHGVDLSLQAANKSMDDRIGARKKKTTDRDYKGYVGEIANTAVEKNDQVKDVLWELFGERNNSGQQLIDEEDTNMRQTAMLQEFLITDPILSEEDPDKVTSLYNTIRKVAPQVASDRNAMVVALRSMVQHDGIAPQDLRQFADTERSIQITQNNQDALNARRYANPDKEQKKKEKVRPEPIFK